MMEFFLSKFWAFVVSMVIMGALVQAMQVDAQSDRDEALKDLADELEAMFKEFAAAGPGLETTIDLCQIMPSTATLTIFSGHALLEEGSREVRFEIPVFKMCVENGQGDLMEMERLVLGSTDILLLINEAEGSRMTVLSQ